ncbi:MAG: hypothetical protein GY855_16605, partial [candidate division Zixibacteria bacterium]|nr:hypothetical protein [candidate division Zixibacteria bacterium]
MLSIKAVLDIGTNCVLLLVAEKINSEIKILNQSKENPRIGEGFSEYGMLNPIPKERGIASISKLLEISQKYKPDQLRAVGTRVFREALNAPSYIEEVKQKIGVDIDVISGEMEAEYSFNGSLYNLDIDMQTVMVVDIGGGSTEISFHSSNGTLLHYSMPVGAVTITENYLNTIPAYALEYDR